MINALFSFFCDVYQTLLRMQVCSKWLLSVCVLVLSIALGVSAVPALAQQKDGPRLHKAITVTAGIFSYFLDSWVIPSSIEVWQEGELLPQDSVWMFDTNTGHITFLRTDWLQDDANPARIDVRYHRLPIGLRIEYYERILTAAEPGLVVEGDTSAVESNDALLIGRRADRGDLFGSSSLQRSGSISRGITVGSNQDASLESGLRFELSGNITEDIEVMASLTDQSTPIQPDGSTQNLREFDQVYIRLQHERGVLQLGDVDVSLRNSEFAQIERRLQGIETQADFGRAGAYQASASVVRGRFRVMEFNGRNGVQGPYRLTGSSGETFINVLAGTERVYLNGQLLVRGEENGYIIDYALGEITFTNRRMIADNSRIAVDFQYVTEQYNRTLITAEAGTAYLLDNRLSVGATVIQESDSRQLNAEVGLTDEEIRILREAGANTENAIISGADSVGYRMNADFVLYARVDTTLQGQSYEIFRAMPEDSSAVWRVRFSRMQDGNGSYRRSESALNGIVYEWAGPGLGSYEPFRMVPAPQQQRMLALRSSFQLSDKLEFFAETAFSELDVNRFSGDSETLQQAMAYNTGFVLNGTETRLGVIDAVLRRRETQSGFSYFDRTREVEFERIWNVPSGSETQETLTDASVGVRFSPFSAVRAGGGYLERPDMNSARAFATISATEEDAPHYNQQIDFVNTNYLASNRESNWFRQTGDLRYGFGLGGIVLTPSIASEAEIRSQTRAESDSLEAGSFRFVEITPGLSSMVSDSWIVGVTISFRNDDTVRNGVYVNESETWTNQLQTSYQRDERLQVTGGIIYREKNFTGNTFAEDLESRATSLLVNTTADYRTPSDWLDLSWQYEAGTESKPLLQETFIEVGPELGNYVWIDLNGDGVQQIDEFFPAQTPNEGIYLRQFVPGDELIPVVSVRTRLRTRIEPGELLGNPLWKQISLSSLFEIREQNQGGSITDIALLNLSEFLDNVNTLEGRMFMQHELQMFRPNRDVDLRFRYDQLTGKNQRATGLEEIRNKTLKSDFSYRLGQFTQAGIELTYGEQDLLNERLSSRAYRIRSYEAEPFLRFAFSRSLQTTTGLRYGNKQDVLPVDAVQLTQYRVYGDMRWFYQARFQTNARIEWRNNRVEGESSSLGQFELTDGAGLGTTWQWSLQGTYRISQYLRANINYDGRTVAQGAAIQTVRFTLNAVF